MYKYKKFIKISLVVLVVIAFGFQAYFDQELRITNGVLVAHVSTIEAFIRQELPGQVVHFDGVQTTVPSGSTK